MSAGRTYRVLGRLCGVDVSNNIARISTLAETVNEYRIRSFRRHPTAISVLAVLAVLSSLLWVYWILTHLLHGTNIFLAIGLVIVQAYAIVSLMLSLTYRLAARRRRDPVLHPPRHWPTIDVFITTYDEEPELLFPTIVSAKELDGEHKVWVLDDGRRESVGELARSLGVGYLTRPDNSHAKAGNINHALEMTDGELILTLDADHVVLPSMLTDLVGLFDDASVALVQTPHEFANTDSVQHYSRFRHEQSLFFRVLMESKDEMNAAFWCGSAAILRRSALLEIGGVAVETVAEDYHTSIKLIKKGWTTRYVNTTYVLGMAPGDLNSYLIQRDRWARGNLSVLRSVDNPLIAKGLSLKQRIAFSESLFAYGSGVMRLLLLLVLVLTLTTGQIPISATVDDLVFLWLPAFLLNEFVFSLLAQGYSLNPEFLHFETLTMEIFTKAWKAVIFRKTNRSFKVTPKTTKDTGGISALYQLKWVIAITCLLVVGVVGQFTGFVPRLPGLADWLVPLLAIIEIRRMLRTMLLVSGRRQQRFHYRVDCLVPCELLLTEPQTAKVDGTVVNVSLAGAGVVANTELSVAPGTQVVVVMRFDGDSVQCAGEVRSIKARTLGILFTDLSVDDRYKIVQYTYANDFRSLLIDSSQGDIGKAAFAELQNEDPPLHILAPLSDSEKVKDIAG
ncbi:glycosyltransferase family 2 protein [Ferrimicrobium sp.]|uniref:glycosyltransferase family 2 protein n=1 Tax=Ferrimicrobium sp. TaxID=2926050 RepID=UPI002610D542|nr:glycosyltransferase family 2 protein [Ferrimicrobium sp.]